MVAKDNPDIVQSEDMAPSEAGHPPDVPADASAAGEYMAIAEASRKLHMPEQAVHYYVKKGLLEGKRHGREWMIGCQSVDKFNELLNGPDEGYAWLFQDYNRVIGCRLHSKCPYHHGLQHRLYSKFYYTLQLRF